MDHAFADSEPTSGIVGHRDAATLALPAMGADWLTLFGLDHVPPASPEEVALRLPEALAQTRMDLSPWLHAELDKHLTYLLGHEAYAAAAGGAPTPESDHVLHDFVLNVAAVLRAEVEAQAARAATAPDPYEEAARAAGVPVSVLRLIEAAEQRLQGWCHRDKSLAIARLVLAERPRLCVEVGVYGGRSLVPCAAALRHLGEGRIVGVESWSPEVAVRDATNATNDAWWAGLDFAPIKREFLRFLVEEDLVSQVGIVEAASADAASLFGPIDYLHIDGSHAALAAAEDVLRYGRRVRPGGVILFDDANWDSTSGARQLLAELADCVDMIRDPDAPANACAVYRRRAS